MFRAVRAIPSRLLHTIYSQRIATLRAPTSWLCNAPFLMIMTLMTIGLTAIGISAHTWFNTSNAHGKTKSFKTRVEPSQAKGPKVRLESELITIGPRGFEPSTITRPKGRIFLAIENRSGINTVTLRVDRVAGNRLKEVTVTNRQLDWIDVVDFIPGTYILTEANHPNWICNITVTPN